MPEKKRNLNMEEKRNLQKLIFADIAAASAKHKAAREKERGVLQEQLVAKASPEVRALVSDYESGVAAMQAAEKQLNGRGYHITSYGDRKLSIAYGKGPHELVAFDAASGESERKFEELKRDFTLRLFAGGEEARELFATLAGELAKIVR